MKKSKIVLIALVIALFVPIISLMPINAADADSKKIYAVSADGIIEIVTIVHSGSALKTFIADPSVPLTIFCALESSLSRSCPCIEAAEYQEFRGHASGVEWCSSCGRWAQVTVRIYAFRRYCTGCGRFMGSGTFNVPISWDCTHGRSFDDDLAFEDDCC